MRKITFISASGSQHDIEAPDGQSAMEAAVQNLVPGIDGDCGGAAACGTCHVFVDPSWIERIGPATTELERQMLELSDQRCERSRLCCQIRLSAQTDGLILHTPDAQH